MITYLKSAEDTIGFAFNRNVASGITAKPEAVTALTRDADIFRHHNATHSLRKGVRLMTGTQAQVSETGGKDPFNANILC